MTKQQTRLQEIQAKLAHMLDAQVALREELNNNDTIISQLTEERKSLMLLRSEEGL